MATFRLVKTCSACPEQYDVYLGDNRVGYMRLRHGYFYAECHGKTVYDAHPDGDGLFEQGERNLYLTAACEAIRAALATGAGGLYEIEDATECIHTF